MKPKVYFTRKITPESLIKIYEALGVPATGKVGIKISTGEPGGHNYLKPELIGDLVKRVNGTILECNTAYGGRRGDTAAHLQAAKEHGFTKIAEVDIMDTDGDMDLPVKGGKQLDVDPVGKNLANYDTVINLAHFKGHPMGGFGGVLKNQSIGIASAAGKAYIHTVGRTRDPAKLMACWSPNPPADLDLAAIQDDFLEAMADAAKAVSDYMKEKTGREYPILYINIINNLSRDCDCSANPEAPCMADIGIAASLDPVALDQAAIDQIWNSNDPGKECFKERVEQQHGQHILESAEAIGLGQRDYELVELD